MAEQRAITRNNPDNYRQRVVIALGIATAIILFIWMTIKAATLLLLVFGGILLAVGLHGLSKW